MGNPWPHKTVKVSSVRLDERNPRLTRDGVYDTQKDIIRHLFEHEDTNVIAQSIATRGFFANEPLLVIKEDGAYVAVEGNRRLAALKTLLKPDLIEGQVRRSIERMLVKAADRDLATVPIVVAPNRRATDKLLAGRHIGTAVKSWDAANRAAFILEKLKEGYETRELRDELGFSDSDVRSAKQTDAIAKIIAIAPLPESIRKRLDRPNSKVLSTVERVVDSTVGRKFLMLEPDDEHGVRGVTSKEEFMKGFVRLLTDITEGKATSRLLNSNRDIEKYFSSIGDDLPKKRRQTFVPSDLFGAKSETKQTQKSVASTPTRSKAQNKWVVPKSFKVTSGSERLIVIRDELTKLDRARFPNAGSVLLRVFLELAMIDYLHRNGKFKDLVERIKTSGNGHLIKNGIPVMRELRKEFTKIAKAELPQAEALSVEKALRKDPGAPFGVDDMHSFVHQLHEFPGDKEIKTFWHRMEPLFNLMLQEEAVK